ncbi:hypothetical protein H6F39_12575 [Anabaena sp. FACHB-1250]|uniref:Uncharacterized protein n=1 Tax=Dolichospermum planctonicum TaxID=136072 RepID=A0A480AD51_9CYAN|nr:hypothetical protein [Dolichospermum planctonicum]MBD2142167.1 hypothetical protein [Anabaena sp. FACHB-1250]GCL41011.1 hypothetical protein NIES80_07030 [Dolichospermum planctonicum]
MNTSWYNSVVEHRQRVLHNLADTLNAGFVYRKRVSILWSFWDGGNSGLRKISLKPS